MAVYTKTGDKWKTSLFNHNSLKTKRVHKDDVIIQTLGEIDEVNSFIGIIRTKVDNRQIGQQLTQVQNNLFTVGAILAGADMQIANDEVKKLEKQIDVWEGQLPVLKNFILPGGSEVAGQLFYARSLVRRAERQLVALNKKKKISENVLKYVNRLSDYLFVFGRFVNMKQKYKEEIWVN